MSLQDAINKILKEMPAPNFFFLYLVGCNLDFASLKMLVERFTDIVRNEKICLKFLKI